MDNPGYNPFNLFAAELDTRLDTPEFRRADRIAWIAGPDGQAQVLATPEGILIAAEGEAFDIAERLVRSQDMRHIEVVGVDQVVTCTENVSDQCWVAAPYPTYDSLPKDWEEITDPWGDLLGFSCPDCAEAQFELAFDQG